MDRRTLLLGLLGGLAATPAVIVTSSSVEAAPLPEAASSSTLTEADLEAVNADWTQAVVDCPARRVAVSDAMQGRWGEPRDVA